MGIRISRLTSAISQGTMGTDTVVAMAMEVMVAMVEAMAGQVVTQTTHTVSVAAVLSFTLEGIAMVAIPTSTPSAIPMVILPFTAVAMLFVVAMDFTGCTRALTTQDMAMDTTDHKGFVNTRLYLFIQTFILLARCSILKLQLKTFYYT